MSSSCRSQVTFSAEFSRWFRDSKVVTPDGRPLVVYHGTASSSWTAEATRNHFERTNGMGEGAYFTPDADVASDYAKTDGEVGDGNPAVIPVFLSIQRPMIFPIGSLDSQSVSREQRAALEAAGYDGVFGLDRDGNVAEIAVFDPTKIKSAICNCGRFDSADIDIRR